MTPSPIQATLLIGLMWRIVPVDTSAVALFESGEIWSRRTAGRSAFPLRDMDDDKPHLRRETGKPLRGFVARLRRQQLRKFLAR